jgi:hypothetical protein
VASACDRLLGWLSQGVAAPPNGLDVILAAAGVSELLSELAYEDVDDLGFRLVVQSAVKMVEEHFLGQSRAYAEGQECEDLVLLGRPCAFSQPLWALSLYQSLGGEHACSESNGGRVGQIHALQFVSGGVQMRFHGAKSQPVDRGNLLIGFAPRRPK